MAKRVNSLFGSLKKSKSLEPNILEWDFSSFDKQTGLPKAIPIGDWAGAPVISTQQRALHF
jgi:hypothetical protein